MFGIVDTEKVDPFEDPLQAVGGKGAEVGRDDKNVLQHLPSKVFRRRPIIVNCDKKQNVYPMKHMKLKDHPSENTDIYKNEVITSPRTRIFKTLGEKADVNDFLVKDKNRCV